jgi:fumarylacetoacetase
MDIDRTHDAASSSWLESANRPDGDFPLQNLPFAVFRRARSAEPFRAGVALGDRVIDVPALLQARCLDGLARSAAEACAQPALNAFFALGPEAWRALRHALFDLFRARGRDDDSGLPGIETLRACLVEAASVEYELPARIGDYTDFYTSIDHARNVGKLFRPEAPLSPNFQWIPIAYHGRASSIGLSGEDIRRPLGQHLENGRNVPDFGPCAQLDYELELGIFIGCGNARGEPIAVRDAEGHVFGLCLLNDWSARDVQRWEMTPLGPFLAKNFATTISPWIVTMDALRPFRLPWTRATSEPQPLPYLDAEENRRAGAIDVRLEVCLQTGSARPVRLSQTSFCHQYWTVAQMVAQHTAGGCNLRGGDLLGSGTISGPTASESGALIELSKGGTAPIEIGPGERRTFLEDGDTVIMRGWCERANFARIGFGENRGRVVSNAA